MDNSFAFFIENRMKNLGISKYHIEPYSVTVDTAKTEEVSAHGEYLYLFDVSEDDDTFIVTANNEIIIETDFFKNNVPYMWYEFTGSVEFAYTGTLHTDLTFMLFKVCPEY